MIVNKQSGVMVAGPLARDPEVKETKTEKTYLNLSVKAQSVQTEAGKWESTFVDCNVWRNYERLDGLLNKGDFVLVFGRALQRHPASNGKIYWSVDADGVFVDGFVNASWVQMAIDMAQQPVEQAGTDDFAPVDDDTPFDPGTEPAQTAFPAEPVKQPAPAAAPEYTGDDRLIETDAEDLPF